jgi:hypothetical protein
MKLYLEDIQVSLGPDRLPHRVLWRLRLYQVRSVDEQWRWAGKWWMTERLRGQRRRYYRVVCTCASGGTLTMEIFVERGRWKLSRLLD